MFCFNMSKHKIAERIIKQSIMSIRINLENQNKLREFLDRSTGDKASTVHWSNNRL